MEGTDFDLGNTLCASLYNKANNKETPLSLGHRNLISAFCKEKRVSNYPGDERLYSIKALPVSQFTGHSKKTAPTPVAKEQDNGGDLADEMNQFKDALMTQLAIAEACNVPHIFYDNESPLYQAAQARRATYEPPPVYPTYPT
ncbi:hypothetical protein A2U01_0042614, partial [Trifolium medium]|nr:hypothetical protein [Trifolium medium]